MVRWLFMLLLVLACTPCFGQAKKKTPPERFHTYTAGAKFELLQPIIVAVDSHAMAELQKSIDAQDDEGIAAMVKERTAVKLEPGLSITVLELKPKDFLTPAEYTECRVIKDGEAIGKYCFGMKSFTLKNMKMTKAGN